MWYVKEYESEAPLANSLIGWLHDFQKRGQNLKDSNLDVLQYVELMLLELKRRS